MQRQYSCDPGFSPFQSLPLQTFVSWVAGLWVVTCWVVASGALSRNGITWTDTGVRLWILTSPLVASPDCLRTLCLQWVFAMRGLLGRRTLGRNLLGRGVWDGRCAFCI